MDLKKEIQIRIADPRIILNEFFGYLSFSTGLITAFWVIVMKLGVGSFLAPVFDIAEPMYKMFNQIMLASCALQNVPLLIVYGPQWRVLICSGILGIVVTNYFATNPIGNAFREGLFVGMIKVDYSYEALVKYHPETYKHESERLQNKSKSFSANLSDYLSTIVEQTLVRSKEMLVEIFKGNWAVFTTDAIRSQFFSSLLRIISATPLFIIAVFELLAYFELFTKGQFYIETAGLWTTISVRALAFSSFIDGLSKIAFGFMRESFMMRLGGCIFAAAQLYLVFTGEGSLQLVIPMSLAGLAAYPIVEGERLRKMALEAAS